MKEKMKDKIKKLLIKYNQTQKDLAETLGITYQSLSLKLNGHRDFTRGEVFTIVKLYELTPDEVIDIFFNDEYLKLDSEIE